MQYQLTVQNYNQLKSPGISTPPNFTIEPCILFLCDGVDIS